MVTVHPANALADISVLALLNQGPRRRLTKRVREREQMFARVFCFVAQGLTQNRERKPSKCA